MRLNEIGHAIHAFEACLSKNNKTVVLLPGSERLMDSTAHLLRSVHAAGCSFYDAGDTDAVYRLLSTPSSMSTFATASVTWRRDLERLLDTVPESVSSVRIVLMDCISQLVAVYRHSNMMYLLVACVSRLHTVQKDDNQWTVVFRNVPSATLDAMDSHMKELPTVMAELCHVTDQLTIQVIPYLSDRRRSRMDRYTAISAIVRIFFYHLSYH
jgi:hypothetical protein